MPPPPNLDPRNGQGSMEENEESITRLPAPEKPSMSENPPRILIIGAGSRGTSYARAIKEASNGILVGVVEPLVDKRKRFGLLWIWGANGRKESDPNRGEEFGDWREFVAWEIERRKRAGKGENVEAEGVDAAFICVQDEMHKEVILGLAPLKLHIMCEKPLATSLEDCVDIYRSLLPENGIGDSKVVQSPERIFSIGHVLRYSPHNMLLRKLLVEEMVIGEILSIEHTEPVGWWHFSHSYVRGNWRNTAKAAPSLLTKSCHDIDFLLWLLCSPPPDSNDPPHLPSKISSSGSLQYFHKGRKPKAAGNATNCLSCSYESDCLFSAKKIYLGSEPHMRGFGKGNTNFPIHILVPEIEDLLSQSGPRAGEKAILAQLEKDYDDSMPKSERDKSSWYGRCVYESDNDVCDNQVVTITWEDAPLPVTPNQEQNRTEEHLSRRRSKQAIFHMTSHTKKQCDRYSQIFGTLGEIWADGSIIVHENFMTGETKKYYPHVDGVSGHGGGDSGLTRQFVLAVDKVKNGGMEVREAQRFFVGCDLEEILRSHAVVWAAEEARVEDKVVRWEEWWEKEVDVRIKGV